MTSKFFCLMTGSVATFLSLALLAQSPAVADGADLKPDTVRPQLPSPIDVLEGLLEEEVANPEGSQPRGGEDAREFRMREEVGSESQRDTDRRGIVEGVTGERHMPGGGPQN